MKLKRNIVIIGVMLAVWTCAFSQEAAENNVKKAHVEKIGGSLQAAKHRLATAKGNSDYSGMAEAYKMLMHLSPEELQIPYSDSLVESAVRTGSSYEIGSAYITQGVLFNSRKNRQEALDKYLIADLYVRSQEDKSIKYKHQFLIANTKYDLGYYEEAIAMLKECSEYFEDENDMAYVTTLQLLSLSYQKNRQFTLSESIAELGLKKSLELKINHIVPYFLHVIAVNKFFEGDFSNALVLLKPLIPIFLKNADIGAVATSNYYAGKALWDLGKKKEAVPYLKAVDSIFLHRKYITPELRNSFEMLIDYYTEASDFKNASRSAERLEQAENIINREFKYLASNLNKKYDAKATRQIILENDRQYRLHNKIASIATLTVVSNNNLPSILNNLS